MSWMLSAPHRKSDAEIINALRRAAALVGSPLSVNKYRRVRKGQKLPDVHTVYKHFGSWTAAIKAARLD